MNFREKKVTWEEMSVDMKPMSLIDTGREASYNAMMVDTIKTKKQYNCSMPMAIKHNQKYNQVITKRSKQTTSLISVIIWMTANKKNYV